MLSEIQKQLFMVDAIVHHKYEIALVLFNECMTSENPKRRNATVDLAIQALEGNQEPVYNWNKEILPLLEENGYVNKGITEIVEAIEGFFDYI